MIDGRSFVKVEVRAVNGVERIVGAFFDHDLVSYHLPSEYPAPPKLWLVEGDWPITAHDAVIDLALNELNHADKGHFEQILGIIKTLSGAPKIVVSERDPKRSAPGPQLPIPEGFVSIGELCEFLREGWRQKLDDKDVARRVAAFWEKLAAAIEKGSFDGEADQIVRYEKSVIPITSKWLRDIQDAAQGVFDEPGAMGRYLAGAHARAGSIKRWIAQSNYHVPESWFPVATENRTKLDKDLILEAIEAVGPWNRNKGASDYLKKDAYYQNIVDWVRERHAVDVGVSYVKQIVLKEAQKGQKDT